MPALLECINQRDRHTHAQAWLATIDRDSDNRRRIAGSNWRTDPNIPDPIGKAVGENLFSIWVEGRDDPIEIISRIVPPNACCSHDSAVEDPGAALSRVVSLSRFEDNLNRIGPYTGVLNPSMNLDAFLADLDVTTDLEGMIGGGKAFAWCTITSEVATTSSADGLRDQLGIEYRLYPSAGADERFKRETLVEIIYSSDTPPSLHRPTVIEAMDYAPFQPSAKGSTCGQTMVLSSGNPGVTEYVHPQFPANNVSGPIRNRGRLVGDPSDNWIAIRTP